MMSMHSDPFVPPPPRMVAHPGLSPDYVRDLEEQGAAFIGAQSASLQADAERRTRQQRQADLDRGVLLGKYHVAKRTITYLSRFNLLLLIYCILSTVGYAVVLVAFVNHLGGH